MMKVDAEGERKERKREQKRRDLASEFRRHTCCPGCGNYMAWWYAMGLKGKVCATCGAAPCVCDDDAGRAPGPRS